MNANERIAALKRSCLDGPHTRARYKAGCRCMICRSANSRYVSARYRARRTGDTRELVPAVRVLAHLRNLSRKGVGYKSVADAASVSRTTLGLVLMGRRSNVRANTERAVLAVDAGARADGSLVPAGPTWRLIDQLVNDGYTKTQIAQWCGMGRAIQLRRDRIKARSAMRVERLSRLIMSGRLRRAA